MKRFFFSLLCVHGNKPLTKDKPSFKTFFFWNLPFHISVSAKHWSRITFLRPVCCWSNLPFPICPCGLSFTWWRCCGLCQGHKPTELAHSFLFCSCACFCLYGLAYTTVFHLINSPANSLLSHCSSGFNSALLVLSAVYLFMKVSLSPDIILCGWLGLKH